MVQNILSHSQELMQPDELPNLASLTPSFTIRANDAAMAVFADAVLAALRVECPGCYLRFAPESDSDDSEALRQGTIDLYLGATKILRPEIRRQNLLNTRFCGVVGKNHPLLDAPITAKSLTYFDHIGVSRRGRRHGPIDMALAENFGLKRNVALVVPSYFPALHGLPSTDMILAAPDIIADERYLPFGGLTFFDFPFPLPTVQFFQAWHPRYDADPLHRWLRRTVAQVTRTHAERVVSLQKGPS